MKKSLYYIVLLFTMAAVLITPITALADNPGKIGTTIDTSLHRISPEITTQATGRSWLDATTGERLYEYKARIASAPAYIDGQPITCVWYQKSVGKWDAGLNLFTATVSGTVTTVGYDGKDMIWAPQVFVGGKEYTCSTAATLFDIDPVNKNYTYNTLSWDYGVCERHLRLIEGMISETYVFKTDPGADVQIKSNVVQDDKFIGERPVFAYDAAGDTIPISSDKIIKASDLKAAAYPVTIDPTETYTTSASNGYVDLDNTVYATVQGAATGTTHATGDIRIGQYGPYLGRYYIDRGFVYFDTSNLSESATITAANLYLYGLTDKSTTDFNITITNGQPTYPHDPMASGDYNQANYSGDGGEFNTSAFNALGYNCISFNATGLTWINTSGTTKLTLRSLEDINASPSAGYEYVDVRGYVRGAGYWPYLEVTYAAAAPPTVTTQAATYVSKTTAYLNSYLDSGGGEYCNVSFEYYNAEASNNGFETGAPPTGWTVSGAGATWNRTATPYKFGSYSGNLTRAGTNCYFYQNISNYSTYKGAQVTLSMYVNASVAARARIALGDNASTSYSGNHSGDSTWQLLSVTQNISALANNISVSGQINAGNTSAYYDEVMLCDGATCPICTTNDTGVTTGEYSTAYLTGLRGNCSYCFRAVAVNSQGTSYGDWSCFTTSATSPQPGNLSGYPNASAVELTWQKGAGSVNTMIRYKIGAYPSSTSDGDLAYNGSSGGYTHTSLTPGTNYYYRAWSEDGTGVYSVNYSSVLVTTLAGNASTALTPSAPDMPNSWFGSPDYTNAQNLPLYDMWNAFADSISMPRNTFWMLLSIITVIFISFVVFFLSKGNLLIAVGVSAVCLAAVGTMELISWWYVGMYLLIAIGLSYRSIAR